MEDLKETLKELAHAPGVYIYRDTDGSVLYVGKAVDLARRVGQYFTRDDAVGDKTHRLVSQIASIETIETLSEFEALLVEAKLIRTYNPKYNVIARDDKSPIYVQLTTGDQLPRVLLTRKPKDKSDDDRSLFVGPFQSAAMARSILRYLRTVIPYCTQKIRNGKPCFSTHLGLCSPCPSVVVKLPDGPEKNEAIRHYRRNIFRLKALFSGKSKTVLEQLEREMKSYAREKKFEKAATTRNQVNALYGLIQKKFDPIVYLQGDREIDTIHEQELDELRQLLRPWYKDIVVPRRIECIDISNISGVAATGSLVVVVDGKIDRSAYRRFRIRRSGTANDIAMIAEVLERRLGHKEWPLPNLLVIDGGKGQVRIAGDVIARSPFDIPVIGLAKQREEMVIPLAHGFRIVRLPYESYALRLLTRIRDEAHRFALAYHRLLRAKALRIV